MARGQKFVDKYQGLETANLYKDTGDFESVRIPGSDHFLYDPTAPTKFDELRVQQLDSDGHMTTPIEVWTDPDTGILWVLDGRGRFLDVQECNRRRAKEGRDLIKPYLVPFRGDEKQAVARVRIKNYHRRAPTVSGTAVDLKALRDAGWSWEECARQLHVDTKDAEQWGRKLMPLAFCIAPVREAIDKGDLPKSVAAKFGGTAIDGSKALGKKQQEMLLDVMLSSKGNGKKEKQVKTVAPKQRQRIREALSDVSVNRLRGNYPEIARAVAAAIAFVDGDAKALGAWPEVAELVAQALEKPKAEREQKEAA